jgi:serine/threonine protein kinase
VVQKKPASKEGAAVRAALEKEIAIHKSVRHHNVIQLYGSSEDEENIYIIMEYAAAGELFDRIGSFCDIQL